MKNFLASLLIVLAAFLAGRYFFPAETVGEQFIPVVSTVDVTERRSEPLRTSEELDATAYTQQELHTINLFEAAQPSVCYITTKALRRDFFSYSTTEVNSGSGSGFVWDRRGHIVTNYHVVADVYRNGQRGSRALVTLANGDTHEAAIIGVAPEKDLAVLKIDADVRSLNPIARGSSGNIRVGQSVYAIGNPFGLDQTLTTGVVSALDREIKSQAGVPIQGAIQSDAAINPGNSGGPLLDSRGQLIGVNTAIYSPSGASAGIGFSIPVDIVSYVVPDLIDYGEVRRASLGASLRQYGRIKGLIVVKVEQGGPADRAGVLGLSRDQRGSLVLGDVIVGINGIDIRTNTDLYLELEKYDPGDIVRVELLRNEQELVADLKLGSSID